MNTINFSLAKFFLLLSTITLLICGQLAVAKETPNYQFEYEMAQILTKDLTAKFQKAIEDKSYIVKVGPLKEMIAKNFDPSDFETAFKGGGIGMIDLIVSRSVRESTRNLGIALPAIREMEVPTFSPKKAERAMNAQKALFQKSYSKEITLHLSSFYSIQEQERLVNYVESFVTYKLNRVGLIMAENGDTSGIVRPTTEFLGQEADILSNDLSPFFDKYDRQDVINLFAKKYTNETSKFYGKEARYNKDVAGMWKGSQKFYEETVKALNRAI